MNRLGFFVFSSALTALALTIPQVVPASPSRPPLTQAAGQPTTTTSPEDVRDLAAREARAEHLGQFVAGHGSSVDLTTVLIVVLILLVLIIIF